MVMWRASWRAWASRASTTAATGTASEAKLSRASSLFHKLWIVGDEDKLDPIIKQTIDCSFGNATANSGEIGTLRTMEQGSFTGAKRGIAKLAKRYADPRLASPRRDVPRPRTAAARHEAINGQLRQGRDRPRDSMAAASANMPRHRVDTLNLRRDGVDLHAIDAAWSSRTRVERTPLRDDVAVGPRSSDASASATSIF